jgi:hypothetical protein
LFSRDVKLTQAAPAGELWRSAASSRMAFAFNIEPFIGALPVRFGMHRSEVHRLLGAPEASQPIWDRSGTTDFWNESRINVGYDNAGIVKHVGFGPGGCELALCGTSLWSLDKQPDPNPELLRRDPAPVESVGIMIYPALGISTSGYHDGDEAQLALTVSPSGTWDEVVKDAARPDLSKYELHEG